ncbi:MAG: ABC transporter permease [Bryobacterales bacterium]
MLREAFRRWSERRELRRRIEDELAFHYQEALDAALDRGLPLSEARIEASAGLGDRRAAAEACMAVWDDTPDTAPRLRPGRAALAAVAVGVPVLLALLLLPHHFRPLPTQHAEQFHVSQRRFTQASDIAREAPDDVASFRRAFASIGWPGGEGVRVAGELVSSNFFRLQGVSLALGSSFSGDSRHELVLSDALWRNAFAGDPGIVGRTVHVGGRPATIVGVASPAFWFLNRQDRFWLHRPDVAGARPQATALVRLHDGVLRPEAWSRFPAHDPRWIPLAKASRVPLRGALGVAAGALILLAALGLLQAISLVRAVGLSNVSLWILTRNFAVLFVKAIPPMAIAGVLWAAVQETSWLSPASMLGGVLAFVAAFAYALIAVSLAWHSLVDQRLRCHVCLRRLSMPLAQGVFGSILFNLPATEYICAWGHGTLYVPEPTSEGIRQPRWTATGGLWAQLLADRGSANA